MSEYKFVHGTFNEIEGRVNALAFSGYKIIRINFPFVDCSITPFVQYSNNPITKEKLEALIPKSVSNVGIFEYQDDFKAEAIIPVCIVMERENNENEKSIKTSILAIFRTIRDWCGGFTRSGR